MDLPIRYVGFEIPNRFAIGYGLDHAQRYRNLDYVAVLTDRTERPRPRARLTAKSRRPGTLTRRVDSASEPHSHADFQRRTQSMKRFSRSGALVPILIVIVLAFFAQRIISPPQQGDEPTYTEFIAQINDADDRRATSSRSRSRPRTTRSTVVETDGTEYSTGYPDNTEQELVNTLEQPGHRHRRSPQGRRRRSSRCSPTSCPSS